MILLVGAGRFERPTPCAQGRSVVSKGSLLCGPFFMFTTTWGICFSLRGKPKAVNGMGFGTVLTQSFGWNLRRFHGLNFSFAGRRKWQTYHHSERGM